MTQTLESALARFTPDFPLGVAFSGGADSTALLLACVRKWPGQVHALHINHGLQAAALDFETHCQTICDRLSVPLRIARVHAKNARGQSPEDAARLARYQALAQLARGNEDLAELPQVALAQHADDQVETVLLALSRGSGLPGLSGMAQSFERGGIRFIRPILNVRAVELRSWLLHQGFPFVEDPTNADPAYTRNRIRAQLLPQIEGVFPHFRDTFARSAAHVAQAQSLLDTLAKIDLEGMLDAKQEINIRSLRALNRERQANALRHWFKVTYQTAPSTAQLEELLDQIGRCATRGHGIHLKLGAGFVKRIGENLAWYNA